ncbi:hypothetical protein J6590_036391 [Homalodisca vitripennis]|nr:hypothetical protein J6590_036391 [Homalodisca vitripennis]
MLPRNTERTFLCAQGSESAENSVQTTTAPERLAHKEQLRKTVRSRGQQLTSHVLREDLTNTTWTQLFKFRWLRSGLQSPAVAVPALAMPNVQVAQVVSSETVDNMHDMIIGRSDNESA